MVRTKQPRKIRPAREATEISDMLVKDFERQVVQKIYDAEVSLSWRIGTLANSIDVVLTSLPPDIRKISLEELVHTMDEINSLETSSESFETLNFPKSTVKQKKTLKRATAASDDGYVTESTGVTRTARASRVNGVKNSEKRQMNKLRSSSADNASSQKSTVGGVSRTTRSSSRNRNSRLASAVEQEPKRNLLKSDGRCPSVSKNKTPRVSTKNYLQSYGVVTPKVKPNTPLNIMRRPRQGEMVLSMQGSPLLVSSVVQERTANINVPLKNGDVVSLLPNPGLRLSHMPPVDDETLEQLRTLNSHLNRVMGAR